MADSENVKRFRHKSYKQTLREVHLPSAFSQHAFDHDIGDNDSHFHESLNHWRELNLSPAFISFAAKADGLSASMPLLLHHGQEIVDLWLAALDAADDEALNALLDLFQQLAHDLRGALVPKLAAVLAKLLKFLPHPISASALTALLATFSACFKYLLLPLSDIHALSVTWSAFRGTLPKCNPEVQRATAEVWGAALRRLKVTARDDCVRMIVADVGDDIADACAWIFVSACKSVSQTLHTATATLIEPLIQHHLACVSPDASFTLIRRLLTALIHHCKSAAQFCLIADVLVTQCVDVAKSTSTPGEQERLRRMLAIVTVPCAVRQGSRMTSQQLSTLLSLFVTLPLTDGLHEALFTFALAGLTAGDMVVWMGPGRKVLERAWERATLGIELCGALSDLGWGGWKLLGLSHVLKRTAQLLESDSLKMLELLVALHRERRLNEVDIVWKQRFQTWVDARFAVWESTQENMLALNYVLALSSLLLSLEPLLVRVIKATLTAPEPKLEYSTTYANSSWVLGACMQCLSKKEKSTWVDEIDLMACTRTIVEKWSWSANALEGLVAMIGASSTDRQGIALDTLFPSLQASLISHSRSLRLSTLRLLSSHVVNASSGTLEVVKRCLQGEEVSLDVQGARERILRIGRLGPVVKDEDDLGAVIAIRWLIAQFKVNLRPLWSSAAEALAKLTERFGDLVWGLMFEELRWVSTDMGDEEHPAWAQAEDEDGDTISEDEKTWRDPSAHKLRSAVAKWLSEGSARRTVVKSQLTGDRFDRISYESQLLSALGECSLLAEKHSRDLVPHFLSLAGPDAPSKYPRQKMTAWLTLFSKFSNPKALRSADAMHALYISFLSHPDRALQRITLACLLTYKSPHLAPHGDMLRGLLDDTRWRDELTQLSMADIEAQDRAELVEVIIRMLFGMMLEKRGRTRGADRRAAVLTTLGGCTDEELHLLVDLMITPVKTTLDRRDSSHYQVHDMSDDVPQKNQVGFLTLLGDVMKNLGSRMVSRWPDLLTTLLDIVANAHTHLELQRSAIESIEEHAEVNDDDADEMDEPQGSIAIYRTLRQLGLKRFSDFFRSPIVYDFSPYLPESFRAFISPRIGALDIENTQAPSALLELFHAWSLRREYLTYLVSYDNRILPKTYDCLIATNVKPAVVSRVFDIVENLLGFAAGDDNVRETILKPHVSSLLTNLSLLVERSKSISAITDPLGRRQINILSEIALYLTDGNQASILLGLFSPLLRKPTKIVPEKLKADLVKIVCSLIPLIPDLHDTSSAIYTKTFNLLAQLFQSLRSRPGRLALVSTFQCLANISIPLKPLADLLESLNAYSVKRLDEPDFDRRFAAFTELNETIYSSLSSQEWLPVLYNMLNFIQDPDELSVRSNASFTLRRFIEIFAMKKDHDFEMIFVKVLYPGMKNGLRSKNEMVRAEILQVLAYAVATCDSISMLQEMHVLLAGGDEEANFFNNIHHVQVHRRTRAIRRLAEFSDDGKLRSTTLAEIFIPLVGNFIIHSRSMDHHLVNEAITATGRMARHLSWGAYYGLIQQYLRLSREKDASERIYIRTLVSLLDNFHFPMDEVVVSQEEVDVEDLDADIDPSTVTPVKSSETSRIRDAVNLRLIPNLLQHLERRDEIEDSLRIPISIGIVQVAKHLPQVQREAQISRLLTVLSQVLRSKSQDTRDLTRDTLCRIAVLLGPSYLPMMLREMRAALLRGPQLHVLAYVTHALLVHITAEEHVAAFCVLDNCVNDVAHVSAEVIFGQSGKDVQSEEFKTKMREVRTATAKGMDSFSVIAKYITPSKISSLLAPIRSIFQETESLKVMQQAEDILRRISSGLNSNAHLIPSELLVLCHTLISQNARFLEQAPVPRSRSGKAKEHAIVQMKRKVDSDDNHYANNSFRFVIFGLDLFNTAFRRSKFDFQNTGIIARLEPMVTVIGNTLYSSHAQVIVPGLKAAASIVRCPLKNIEKSLPVFVRQMIDIIKQAGSTEPETVQTSLKSLATILREQSDSQVQEKDLVYLLELISPDLEDPSRQTATFAILRAIVARKFVVPEIYDLMEKVSEIMVTSQSPQVQELCRGVLLQFLLDYPQGKGRLRNQMTFLAKNLSYVHESGRKSVMELLSAIIVKFQVSLVNEYSDLLFISLVMVIANDESSKCREMAAELLKKLFSRIETAQRRIIMSHVHSWASQYASHAQLARVSSQLYGIVVDILRQETTPYIPTILADLNAALSYSGQILEAASTAPPDEDYMEVEIEWQIPYHALVVLSKILREFPALSTQEGSVSWAAVAQLLLFPHAWVRMAACRLLGQLFTSVPPAAPQAEVPEDSPLSRIGMEDVAQKLCLQLRSPNLDSALGVQIVKNLFYIGKCFSAIELPVAAQAEEPSNEEPGETPEDEVDGPDIEEDTDTTKRRQTRRSHPLPWLFSKLSYQAKSAHIARRSRAATQNNWSEQPTAVLKWFAAMASFMSEAAVERFLVHILTPVYRLTEDDTIHDSSIDDLKTLAVELQDLVQSKVGTTKFADVYNRIRQGVLGVRRERRTARVVQATTHPEASARRKAQRNVMKKESRKRKARSFTENASGQGKRRREE